MALFNWMYHSKDENPGPGKIAASGLFSEKITVPRLRYLITDLNKQLETFLALRKMMSDNGLYNTVLLQALSVKNCDKSFSATYRLQDLLHHSASAGSWLQKFIAEENRYIYFSTRQKRNVPLHYDKLLLNLDAFYTAKKLQLQCEIVNAKSLMTDHTDLLPDVEIIRLAQAAHLRDIPAVKIYYLILLMLKQPAVEKHFADVNEFIEKHKHLFPVEEEKDLYNYIKNYCIKKINEGDTAYLRKLFEIYKNILADRRMMNHDYFSQWEFKNLVTISLRLNEGAWCKQFIKKYINHLAPPERVNAFNYNMAYLYWYEKKFRLSLKMLQKVEFTDVVYQLDSRAVILKIYYETDDEDSLYYHLSAFRAFLRRNRAISENLREQYSNLIRYTARISRHGWNFKKWQEIKADLQKNIRIADKGWLELQLAAFDHKKNNH